ncbi:hypothetical protein GGR55DRAFT_656974 [Xylaria sp. FL0064]|nr:hypothetical protein GGR55DRAFT_656974 [Xylaria sp. FL0064]
MNTRRTRATTRREETPESTRPGPVTRQTRSGSKRAELSDASPQSKSIHYPQRGTRRRRRRSLESVATNDFPKSSAEHASPKHPTMEAPEPMSAESGDASDTESQDDSYEDRVARLQDILDFDLPKLSRWCEKVYEALCSLTYPEPAMEERKRLRTARKFFEMARRPFATGDAAYINLRRSKLPYRDDPSAHAAIQKFTREANSVFLLLSITDLKRSKKDAWFFFKELDDEHPLFPDSDPSNQSEYYSLAFRVRCRRLVELLKKWKDQPLIYEPLTVASGVFCELSASTAEEAAQQLREGPFKMFGGEGQGREFALSAELKAQMNELIDKLTLPETAAIERSLDEMFPQDELLEDLRKWATDTYLQVTKKVDESDLPPGDQNEGDNINVAGRAESEGLFLSDDNEPNGGSNSESSSEPEEYHQLKTLTKEPSFIQDPSTLAAVRRSERGGLKRSRIEPPSNQRTGKGKSTESQITDAIRRLNAAEILGDSGDDANDDIVPPVAGASDTRSRSASQELGATGKRTHAQEDEDYVPENDDDFEVNRQVINESRRNQYEGSNVSRPVPKRSRLSVDLGRRGGRPQSLDPTPATTNITGDDLATLSRAARANKLANKSRVHQVRERWSDADTDRLLDLIADPNFNCSWSEMEKKGNFQTYRNQQAIRDKARNLKKGYLCADAILPSGFDLVYLSKKEKADVIASGRNPDRMEDDVDERGRVIHNLLKDR